MKILYYYLTIITLCLISCSKEHTPGVSPTPTTAALQFLHMYRAAPISGLSIHRFSLRANTWILLDSSKTGSDGIVYFTYPDSAYYQLRVISSDYSQPIYLMEPARNTGLIMLMESAGDFPATYMGTNDTANNFRVYLY